MCGGSSSLEVSACTQSQASGTGAYLMWLSEYGCCTKEEIKAIQQAKRKEVDAAVEFAKKAPEPPAKELVSDIYSGMKVAPRMCVA